MAWPAPTLVSGRVKPASRERVKTYHFEREIASGATWGCTGRDERTQSELTTKDHRLGRVRLVAAPDSPGAGTGPFDGEAIRAAGGGKTSHCRQPDHRVQEGKTYHWRQPDRRIRPTNGVRGSALIQHLDSIGAAEQLAGTRPREVLINTRPRHGTKNIFSRRQGLAGRSALV